MRSGPPYGPRNTFSNLGYAVAGLWIAARYPTDTGAVMAVSLWLLATGSALYHGYKTLLANRLDWIGMLAVFTSLATANTLGPWRGAPWAMLALSALAGFTYARVLNGVSRDWWMVVLGLIGAARPFLWHRYGALALGLGAMAVAYTVWQLDKARSRWVGVWGHAIWHVLTAVGIAVLFAGGQP